MESSDTLRERIDAALSQAVASSFKLESASLARAILDHVWRDGRMSVHSRKLELAASVSIPGLNTFQVARYFQKFSRRYEEGSER